jgi:retinol dehydrogenase 12
MYPAPMGAITQLYAATSPELKKLDSGRYFIPWARAGTPKNGTQDLDIALKLWDFLEEAVKRDEQTFSVA